MEIQRIPRRVQVQIDATPEAVEALDTINVESPFRRWLSLHLGVASWSLIGDAAMPFYVEWWSDGQLVLLAWVMDKGQPSCPYCPRCVKQHEVRVPLRAPLPVMPDGIAYIAHGYRQLESAILDAKVSA